MLAYDLGGHDAYYYTSQFLHYNCSQNVVFLCQALGSDKYEVSFQWLQATMTRSPECLVIPVLTKADEVPVGNISDRKEKFTTEMKQFLDKEIIILDKVHKYSKGSKDETDNRCKLETYRTFLNEFEERLFVISVKQNCPQFDNVEKLCTYIEGLTNQENYQVEIPKLYEEFYRVLGKMGAVLEVKSESTEQKKEQRTIVVPPKHIQIPLELKRNNEVKMDPEGKNRVKETNKDNKIEGNNVEQIRETDEAEVNSLLKCSEPVETKRTNKGSYSELKSQPSSSLDIPPVKLEKLQSEGKIILLSEAAKIYDDISKKYPGSCGDVKKCLTHLNSYGLCLWFQGHPQIEKIIFNNFVFFKDLLSSVFSHEALILSFSELDIDLQLLFEDFENNFLDSLQRIRDKGLFSKAMLQVLLNKRKLDKEVETVVQLLQQLHIAHCHSAGKEIFLFIPYFVDKNEIPDFIKRISTKITVCSKDELALNFQLKGNIPSTFWHQVCVKLMDELYDPSETQQWGVFKNGLWAQVDALWLFIQSSENMLKVTIRGRREYDDVCSVWEHTNRIDKILKNIIKHSWPGLAPAILIDCSHCRLRTSDMNRIYQLSLCKMLETGNNKIYSGCKMDTGLKHIPSLFVRPPSKGILPVSIACEVYS